MEVAPILICQVIIAFDGDIELHIRPLFAECQSVSANAMSFL